MRMFKLLSTAYSSIYVDDAARVLGVSPAEATSRKYLPFSTYMVADFSAKTQTLGPPARDLGTPLSGQRSHVNFFVFVLQ
jgi:hypothetical protein